MMETKLIHGIPHKKGRNDRYFYFSQYGEWNLSPDQEKVARRFGDLPEIVLDKKSISLPPAIPRRDHIEQFLKLHPRSTVSEVSHGITAYVFQVAPLLNDLLKKGKVRKMAKRRCTKSNHQASQWIIK